MTLPLIAIPCCRQMSDQHAIHMVGEKYILAGLEAAGCLPVLIPALGDRLDLTDLIGRFDGLLLTGSPSNVEPHHYDGPAPPADNLIDPDRDATTLPLIRAAVAARVPVLGICRGHQELNVALGGSLHQEVQEIAGRMDHRSDKVGTAEHKYRIVHPVTLVPGGLFERLAGSASLEVNSLHGQGIDRPAPGLATEALAPDGQIEGVRLEGADFVVGVQWHPEWRTLENAFSVKLFEAFGAACARRARGRAGIDRAA
ncbi:MAG TPA: gamma-glutamyl-gamma-aminobutyrate hydrolase family protein [Aliidongia sp.]|uniref:gamma-glutamyl-gamma-aminobutyrate hydrolase family protein n=1 Tax=Aliidongia sp. TaxID=1914230 RepID=UPI002DDD9A3F|nr:gamma-glutamyl-gamma-aminobutyrate hydrolase family protein [Aliidongia sp.]HEV2677708.1 gamma-glutamyl-gamma-aminobutyrate hydrolase family protein [Aliidongia sp.]